MKTEFIIWGIPKNETSETILLSEKFGIKSKKEAEYFANHLKKDCANVRIQELKFDNKINFVETLNLKL